ncbi:DUF3617 domain-containing protein [Pelomonas sp. APW6]|uniref:DUF3617 domain-containing protein n=1 Tax=Roseateles subflavus TaxID=3053353 RepID=A0ABT7LMU5_9BURK|nr:DUF3617 domain-containing protein [Pelomonas sp. APW6]MDL5034187.1 DUF3617 domain-containing protein [Pelomonas sp. APW6]
MSIRHRTAKAHPLARILLLSLMGALPLLAGAETMKAGLWELSQKTLLDPAQQAQLDQARQAMANMPAEQRQQMEQMMRQRGVQLNLGQGSSASLSFKVCISKEQAERQQPPIDESGRCKHDGSRSGNTGRMHFVCNDPPAEGSGEFTFDGPGHYTSKMTIQTQGRTISSTGEGRWLGADCGNLKPSAR